MMLTTLTGLKWRLVRDVFSSVDLTEYYIHVNDVLELVSHLTVGYVCMNTYSTLIAQLVDHKIGNLNVASSVPALAQLEMGHPSTQQ